MPSISPPITQIGPCSPFFIVSNMAASLGHYHGTLGFDVRHRTPDDDPFFAIVGRGPAQLMLKAIDGVLPTPNPVRHAWARWDVFIFVEDPDALAREFVNRDVTFHGALDDTDDGLRGFEVADPDSYVCFFGRPL